MMHSKLPYKSNNTALPKVPHGDPERAGYGNLLAATPKGFSRRLHRKQTAEYLGVSLSWLDKARLTGLGPPYIAIGVLCPNLGITRVQAIPDLGKLGGR